MEVCSRLVLAATFLVAGASKLRDLDAVARTAAGFGLPARLVPVARVGVPAVEIVVAVGLLVADTARVAALVALVLLAAFSVAMGRVLARGEQVPCRCFGAASATPVRRGSLVRNVVLMTLAALVLGGGDAVSLPGWIGDRDGTDLADPGPRVARCRPAES